jgi:VWFA-related protein
MTRRAAGVVAGVLSLGALAAGQSPAPQRPAFRSGTDVVFVDVAVRGEMGGLVTGLTAADFVLTDNGVRQKIDSVEPIDLPIDLTLVVDVSDDPNGSRGRPIARVDPKNFPAQIDRDVQRTVALLRPHDRLRLMASDTYGIEIWPFMSADALRREAPAYSGPAGGMASVHDTVAAALLQPVPLDRRHVVLVRTKAEDTISALDGRALLAIAEQSPAMLHVVVMEAANADAGEIRSFQCQNAGLCEPSRRFWVPFRRPSQAVLTRAAEMTGGAQHVASGFTEPSFPGTFTKILDDFRRSYVLRYTPQGVDRVGWHEIKVTTPRSPKAIIHARRGYAVDAPPAPRPNPAPVIAPAPAGRAVVDLPSLGAAYERGEYRAVAAALGAAADPARLIRDFMAAGNPWPASPRREAVFVLELAEAALFSIRPNARGEGLKLLAAHQLLVRPALEPDAYERDWLFAAVALLEGVISPDAAAPFVANALRRFPNEPRFVLADAILADQRARLDAGLGAAVAIAGYEAAMAHPEVAAEARIRLGLVHLRAGDPEKALMLLDFIDDAASTDRPMRFFRQLFRGHALAAQKRLDLAALAYEAALAVWPGAQSARVGLMTSRLRLGDRAAAEGLAEQVQAAPADVSDPWWRYWYGDYRFFAAAIERLREMGR